jgi:hypothetical protein
MTVPTINGIKRVGATFMVAQGGHQARPYDKQKGSH